MSNSALDENFSSDTLWTWDMFRWIVKQCYFDNEANANVLKVSGDFGTCSD